MAEQRDAGRLGLRTLGATHSFRKLYASALQQRASSDAHSPALAEVRCCCPNAACRYAACKRPFQGTKYCTALLYPYILMCTQCPLKRVL